MSIQSLQQQCADLQSRIADAKRRHVAHTFLEWRLIQTKTKLLRAEDRQERRERKSA